eukprot:m.21528 g.21528  ORF g.21528 m.21528 type:complete len:55 (+) comp8293_c0_seq1:105-269(+)
MHTHTHTHTCYKGIVSAHVTKARDCPSLTKAETCAPAFTPTKINPSAYKQAMCS